MADSLIAHMRLSSLGSAEPGSEDLQLRYPRPYERVLKRVIDTAGAACLIVISSPLLIALAALIRMLDGAPVIYRRRVIGPRGEFDAFKFRTMCRNADAILAA